jgi:hypothetical protein
MPVFTVTYSIVTEESAADGDYADCGLIGEGLSLRDAVALVNQTRTSQVGGVASIESDEWPMRSPRSVIVTNGNEYLTGDCEERSLHMPDALSDASRRRIARLLGVRG